MRYFTLVLVLALSLTLAAPITAQETSNDEQYFAIGILDWLEMLWNDWFVISSEKDGEATEPPIPSTGDDGSGSGPGDNSTGYALPNG